MIFASFWHVWIWPAGLSGGTPGDVFASLVYSVLVAIGATLLWPRLRHAFEKAVKSHTSELHRKLDHIIEHHPDIPDLPEKPK